MELELPTWVGLAHPAESFRRGVSTHSQAHCIVSWTISFTRENQREHLSETERTCPRPQRTQQKPMIMIYNAKQRLLRCKLPTMRPGREWILRGVLSHSEGALLSTNGMGGRDTVKTVSVWALQASSHFVSLPKALSTQENDTKPH